jgi:hypothetical protein
MSFEQSVGAFPLAVRRRRAKPLARRLARDLRVLAPLVAVLVEAIVAIGAIVLVERLVPPPFEGAEGYWSTTSISSTSNVSAAPPGMPPGDPRSP